MSDSVKRRAKSTQVWCNSSFPWYLEISLEGKKLS